MMKSFSLRKEPHLPDSLVNALRCVWGNVTLLLFIFRQATVNCCDIADISIDAGPIYMH